MRRPASRNEGARVRGRIRDGARRLQRCGRAGGDGNITHGMPPGRMGTHDPPSHAPPVGAAAVSETHCTRRAACSRVRSHARVAAATRAAQRPRHPQRGCPPPRSRITAAPRRLAVTDAGPRAGRPRLLRSRAHAFKCGNSRARRAQEDSEQPAAPRRQRQPRLAGTAGPAGPRARPQTASWSRAPAAPRCTRLQTRRTPRAPCARPLRGCARPR
jgi:hypothetical protein